MSGPSKLQIDQAEIALLALLQRTISTAINQKVDVQSLGSKDFNEEGDLIMSPPSIRMRFAGATYNPLRDNQRLSYEAGLTFEVMCFDESLRSRADSRMKSLVLVAAVEDQLAGARLPLADGTSTFPVQVESVSPLITESGPIDQLYIVTVLVGGIAQFFGRELEVRTMTSDFCNVRLSSAAAVHQAVTIATARFHYTFLPGTAVRVLTSEWTNVLSNEEIDGVKLFEIEPQAAS